jgi:hypothetical protein
MGKTWHFILCYVIHTKTNFLAKSKTQKENTKKKLSFKSNKNKTKKVKNYRVASRKALSL